MIDIGVEGVSQKEENRNVIIKIFFFLRYVYSIVPLDISEYTDPIFASMHTYFMHSYINNCAKKKSMHLLSTFLYK